MPVAPTYPGVYIEELPSGVQTITGVATSIGAFIGWAPQGPIDHAQLVLSWPDYSRQFGGLDSRSYLGYAVYDFFANGGQQAYIVRLVDSTSGAATQAAPATVTLAGPAGPPPSSLVVNAVNPGMWGNHYGILIKNLTGGRFRLQVADTSAPAPAPPVIVESWESLSMSPMDSRYVQSVINGQSSFITVTATGPAAPNDSTGTPPVPSALAGGQDGNVLAPGNTTGAFENALTATGAGFTFLERVDLFNLLCIPGEGDPTTLSKVEGFCHDHRAMLIIDSQSTDTFSSLQTAGGPNSALTAGDNAANAAFYFPWINAPDPQQNNVIRAFPPCGFVAGTYARIDGLRGVWKAPAGTEASLTAATGAAIQLTDLENGFLNPVAVNCIRNFNVYGTVLWGARTCQGNDQLGSQWKYVPVRRIALFIEESLFRALKWVVFEPNDEPLWAQIRLNVGAFMQNLFRQGAFQGKTPADAYFVKCDKETTTQNDINLGIVNIVVGFAPLKPAEFVILQIQQMAGQIAT
jgi:phage tail sheath protein FI